MTFTNEELIAIARKVDPGSPEVIERDGLRFTFGTEYDDRGVMENVNDCDAYGKLAWPVRDRYADHERRPDDFTGAARKFRATQMHDEIWWEPYRDETKVYDGPDEVRFMRELLDWGFIALTLRIDRRESCGHFHEVTTNSLWGIESPLVGDGNYDYLGDIYADLITDALHELEAA